MHSAIPFYLARLIAVAITIFGCSYLVSPDRASGSFGLKPPRSDADTRAWPRLKGGMSIGIARADDDAGLGQASGRHGSTRGSHRPFWRYVNHSGVGRIEVESVPSSWRNLSGDTCRWSLVDPCHLRGMALTALPTVRVGSQSAVLELPQPDMKTCLVRCRPRGRSHEWQLGRPI
jgi:hypothetical protein